VAWTPPLDADGLASLLAKIKGWQPFDGDAVLDDVGAVLDDVIPPETDVAELARRLRRHLVWLIDVAIAAEACQKDEHALRLVQHARAVRSEAVPADFWPAVGHLRRVAWSVNELLERLGAIRCIKEAA
jgi:hypothetical protein